MARQTKNGMTDIVAMIGEVTILRRDDMTGRTICEATTTTLAPDFLGDGHGRG